MRALVAGEAGGRLALQPRPEPQPAAGDVVVRVCATSVNRGELHRLAVAAPGWRPGWDFAGTVAAAAGGFVKGQRVFGVLPEAAWAERIAAPHDHLARMPDQLTWEQGAALPIAGLTALRMLELPARPLLGAGVLVTGAAGGVGRLALQLAHLSGAQVTAVARGGRRAGLAALGAARVVSDISQLDRRFDLILESAGGESLAQALSLVAADGVVITYGSSSQEPTTIDVRDFYPSQAVLRGFHLLHDLARRPPARDLERLAGWVRDGRLVLDVAHRASWEAVNEVLDLLRRREIDGKAVLTVGASHGG